MARDEGPLPRYPSRAERQAAKDARRAAGRQLTTEDRLAYAQERSAADHDHEQQKLRAARREDEQPLDLLNISTESRIEFARLHDALIVDEAGLPRLRPDFLRYLDGLRGEASGEAEDDPAAMDPDLAALLDGWRYLAQEEPLQAHVLYQLHVLGRSQAAAAEELGMDRMLLRSCAHRGESYLNGFARARRSAMPVPMAPAPLRATAGACGQIRAPIWSG